MAISSTDCCPAINYVYLLRCADGTLYCGWTTNLQDRLKAHNNGTGAKYTRSRRPVELAYFEEYEDRHAAMSREWHIKRMSRAAKEKLIRTFLTGECDDLRTTGTGRSDIFSDQI